jgi:hypothetical protein
MQLIDGKIYHFKNTNNITIEKINKYSKFFLFFKKKEKEIDNLVLINK